MKKQISTFILLLILIILTTSNVFVKAQEQTSTVTLVPSKLNAAIDEEVAISISAVDENGTSINNYVANITKDGEIFVVNTSATTFFDSSNVSATRTYTVTYFLDVARNITIFTNDPIAIIWENGSIIEPPTPVLNTVPIYIFVENYRSDIVTGQIVTLTNIITNETLTSQTNSTQIATFNAPPAQYIASTKIDWKTIEAELTVTNSTIQPTITLSYSIADDIQYPIYLQEGLFVPLWVAIIIVLIIIGILSYWLLGDM